MASRMTLPEWMRELPVGTYFRATFYGSADDDDPYVGIWRKISRWHVRPISGWYFDDEVQGCGWRDDYDSNAQFSDADRHVIANLWDDAGVVDPDDGLVPYYVDLHRLADGSIDVLAALEAMGLQEEARTAEPFIIHEGALVMSGRRYVRNRAG